VFRALRIPDFRLLWAGGLISSLGSWLLVLAVPAHILAVTGSLRDTGLTLAAEYLPQLVLGPVAGVVADRWDRRRLMIATNLFCAGAVAVLQQAASSVGMRGTVALIGGAPAGASFSLDHMSTLWGKRVVGILGGEGRSASLIGALIALNKQGRFPYDKLITSFPLDQVNDALEASRAQEGRAMALLRLDRIEGASLSVDGRAVEVEWPSYLGDANPSPLVGEGVGGADG